MKMYVKFIGTEHLQGSYFTTGLTLDRYYEFKKIIDNQQFVVVRTDNGDDYAYHIELFEM